MENKKEIDINTYENNILYIKKIYCFMEGYVSLKKFEEFLYSIEDIKVLENNYYLFLVSYNFIQKNAEKLLKNDIAEWFDNILNYNSWLFLITIDCILDGEISIYNGLREISIINLEENLMPIELTGYLSLLDNEPESYYKEDIFELIIQFRKTIIKNLTISE